MQVLEFLKKHKTDLLRVAAILCIIAVTSAFISAFKNGKLPHSADGDAFDSIYALGNGESASE